MFWSCHFWITLNFEMIYFLKWCLIFDNLAQCLFIKCNNFLWVMLISSQKSIWFSIPHVKTWQPILPYVPNQNAILLWSQCFSFQESKSIHGLITILLLVWWKPSASFAMVSREHKFFWHDLIWINILILNVIITDNQI